MSNEFKNPIMLAMNLIRHIGDVVSNTNSPISLLGIGIGNWNDEINASKIIGSPNSALTEHVINELIDRKLIIVGTKSLGGVFGTINLTFDGWALYEAEKRGQVSGNYGFIAMQFGDADLDPFVRDVVKPSVKADLDYDLVDMRDVARAGVIDNIMRAQIRDSTFIIVDLTHDNPGAYWEAGYAEGLGKPVIYICEKEKFDAKKTHFDTNHCTTVPWSRHDGEGFRQALIATLRNSLESKADSHSSWLNKNPLLLRERAT